jgi:hypothetical protein
MTDELRKLLLMEDSVSRSLMLINRSLLLIDRSLWSLTTDELRKLLLMEDSEHYPGPPSHPFFFLMNFPPQFFGYFFFMEDGEHFAGLCSERGRARARAREHASERVSE